MVIEEIPTGEEAEDGSLFSLCSGLLLAGIFVGVAPLRATAKTLTIIIHELGHSIFGWLFGYPTVPSLDLRYGGGIAIHASQSLLLLVAIIALLGWSLSRLSPSGRPFYVGCGVAVLYLVAAFTSAHRVLILFMGHGFELLLAAVFLYRAMSGTSIVHAIERPLYAALGFFIIIDDAWFAYSILTSTSAKTRYLAGKGGHLNDFHRIATEHLGVSLEAVVLFFLCCCFLVPVASYLAYHVRETT